ncbi:hypothetical protein [Aridibaculum aurantiacum]|uniref:hypothetical protein n=1 Tax=Aridibaculum aurantiacum TaxID=2810307 RepID=UPI001A9792EE|nr:hypothetical protein [Aridibaculum aurantiacum]
MAKRDPEKTARNKVIKELKEKLRALLPSVLEATGFESEYSLHGKIGGKFGQYLDIKNVVVDSPQQFIALWLDGFKNYIRKNIDPRWREGNNHYETYKLLQKHKVFQDYLYLFLERTYIKHIDALSKKRPTIEEAEIWIGQANANYGILVTPRFNGTNWENDKSEIRHFPHRYWSIGHILATGLVVPFKNAKLEFKTVEEYLNFFTNVIVRNSGSEYEYKLAEMYSIYVNAAENPHEIPLLIPEFRYDGLAKKHKYRLDFTIIEASQLNKIGFELSPWSTHGYLSKTKSMSQEQINDVAKGNFENEMSKHKSYFKKHGIFVLIYTDFDLKDLDSVFRDMELYLRPKSVGSQMKFHIFNDFFNDPL